jgi:riboflavin synthase
VFTGIVTERGLVRSVKRRRGLLTLEVEAPPIAKELRVGDSIAVNGVCLTATRTGRRRFWTQVMEETLQRSTLGEVGRGSALNLELAARLSDRLGGHLVQGHVDGTARVSRMEDDEGATRVWFSAASELLRYMVAKGSVTLDGVSLTLVEVGSTSFQVALIPHTMAETTLGALAVGSEVNVEVDIVAKYVERFVRGER